MFAQRFDHDFLGVVDGIHDQSKLLLTRFEHYYIGNVVVSRLGTGSFQVQHCIQTNQREELAAQPIDRRAKNVLNSFQGLFTFQANQLHKADLRDGKTFAASRDHQCRNDGQGQRNLDAQSRAFAQRGLNIHRTADFLDISADNIHADATTGYGGHLVGGGQTRQENQIERFPICHSG